jgi:hypothetical protein
MTLAEALAIAAQVKPKHQQPLDKLQGTVTVEQFSSGVTALSKSYAAMGGTVADLRKRVDHIAADVEYLENFTPGAPPRRLQ